MGDREGEDEEDLMREAREGEGRAIATKRHKGSGVEGAVVREQVCEGAVRAQVSKGDVVRACGSEGSVVNAQVIEVPWNRTQEVL